MRGDFKEMTDPRIEAAARELKRLFSESEQSNDAMWLSCAKCILDAADAAAWRPIESAPRDGTHIFVPMKFIGADVVAYDLGAWRETTNMLRLKDEPTHWQPLPAPPKDEVKE